MNNVQLIEEMEHTVATDADLNRHYADDLGASRPDCAWVLTPFDVWEPNPYYRGRPQAHPEECDGQIVYLDTATPAPLSVRTPLPDLGDDIPF